jgi:hypothetical protein
MRAAAATAAPAAAAAALASAVAPVHCTSLIIFPLLPELVPAKLAVYINVYGK